MSKPSTKQKVKEAAESLLLKLVDSLDSKKDESSEEAPPKPPPKPASYLASLKPNDLAHSAQNMLHSFNGLKLSDPTGVPATSPDPGFVGGFHPGYVPNGNEPGRPPLAHASSAPPPQMPVPFPPPSPGKQSLAMQMALDPGLPLPPRPSSTPGKPSSSKPAAASPSSTPTKPKPSKASAVQTPTKASSSASSPPSTPSGKAGQVQCSGTTKAGKQCSRFVKTVPALELVSDEEDGELNPPIERFCHQHTKELLGNSGYYARKNGEWVKFSDWIPVYLQAETRTALQVEMERSRSQSDVDGYIYTFEIREEEITTVKLKVGRAVNLTKRIDQWSKQCGSKEQVLRGYYPGPEAQGEAGNDASMMKGRVKAGEKAPCCHRLERLIHLELADLVSTRIYLDSSWPDVDYGEGTGQKPNTQNKERCEDCGSTHKEIFEFERWPATHGHRNKEWEGIVKPVIERWGRFVELYV
ncbi:hypothetical protein EST38_g6974 [Candolleomyces aberdarensis]|uniref:DUF1766-domain-containing protein n=1 Tax=Candolleomyces aberdarensis TaxID=2316362 RepID=A0A4Q2DGH3_9AGAR|nr:hypothetical protein EST38_g6974 [Candolleomyces aberdarensis]